MTKKVWREGSNRVATLTYDGNEYVVEFTPDVGRAEDVRWKAYTKRSTAMAAMRRWVAGVPASAGVRA